MQWILVTCIQSEEPLLITVCRKTLPALKKSVYRDFIEMLESYGLYDETQHNKSDNIIKIGNSTIEFISVDQSQKIRGAKRDILWINECNEVTREDFFQLQIRTTQKIFADFNPTEVEGWWIDLIEKRQEEVDFNISTFRDNPFLEQSIIDEIERLKDVDPDYYQIYNQGIASRSTEAVYKFEEIDSIPVNDAQFIGIGIDFGFSNDPTAAIEVWKHDNNIYLNELMYKRGLTNSDIAEELKAMGVDKRIDIVCDSSEPKSVEELRRFGYRTQPARKGPDSILNGIDILKRHKLYVTSESVNLITELRRYKWLKDANGVLLNRPVDAYNHALDAIRYIALNMLSNKNKGAYNITVGGSTKLYPAANDELRQSIKKYNIR
jgi:phage terminase large subunit